MPFAVHVKDVGLAILIEVEDLDVALEHEEEVHAALAPLEDERPLREPFLRAVGHDPRGHLLAQTREGLRLARIRVARIEIRFRLGGSVGHQQESWGANGAVATKAAQQASVLVHWEDSMVCCSLC